MTSDAAQAAPAPASDGTHQPQHAKKASMEDVFEHRWRKAYEVRALERESRQSSSRRGSCELLPNSTASPDGAPAIAGKKQPQAAVGVHATAGTIAAGAVSKLSLSGCGGVHDSGGAAEAAAGGAGGAGKAPSRLEMQRRREQEIVDDDDEDAAAAGPAGAAESAGAGGEHPATAAQQPGSPRQGEAEEEPELEVRVVWDSSSRERGAAAAPQARPGGASAVHGQAAQLKEQGNAHMKEGQLDAAVLRYSQALVACGSAMQSAEGAGGALGAAARPQRAGAAAPAASAGAAGAGAGPPAAAAPAPAEAADDRRFQATLHSNRSHALLKLKRFKEAAADAEAAHRLHPSWPKPLYRLAQARAALGQWPAAVGACRRGHELSPKSSEGHSDFTPLWDWVAVHAARAGSLAGFDGQQLEVRSAGEEAWLGRPAPHVPELDGPEDEDSQGPATTLPAALPDAAGAGGALVAAGGAATPSFGDPLVAWDYRQTAAALQRRRRTSFRSVKEAVTAARDGDRIVLRCGVHNGMGESVTLTKRLLIEGEGQLGEASIDQRANCPMFRIKRGGVVLRNIELDQTGFRDALLVDGPSSVHPLITGCTIKCSGDDAVNVCGAAAPTFLRCLITAKKVGVKAWGSAAPKLEQCLVQKCGEQGVRAQESAAPVLHACVIEECEEEAAVAFDSARLTLLACTLRGCKGPGVDVSGDAHAAITGGSVAQCVGGVWAWERARVALAGATVAGGPSHALLADGEAHLEVRESRVQGSVHATEGAWAGILHPSNALEDPEQPTDFPPEEGPFRFVPDRFKRKQ